MAKKMKHMSDVEHVLLRPGMYIGSITSNITERWAPDIEEPENIVWRSTELVPGLLKIYDEAVTNALDASSQSYYKVKNIYVNVDKKTGFIEVINDGVGIPHKDVRIAFGELRSSTNYNDDEKRLVGGTNGLGIKACNIYSKEFNVDTAYKNTRTQITWKNNMSEVSEPIKEKISAKEAKEIGVRVRFLPDYERFGMKKGIKTHPDLKMLMYKRVLDIAAVSGKKVNVHWNQKKIQIQSFKDYIEYYLDNEDTPFVYESINDRWEVAIAFQGDDDFRSISFVNGIDTFLGGPHVDHVVNQIVKKLTAMAKSKAGKKSDLKIRPNYIKMRMWVFVNCKVENPSFASQTKEMLTTKKFGSTCPIPDKLVANFAKKSGILKVVQQYAQHQANSGLSKTDGKKTRKIRGIPNLEDANKAGTVRSSECTLMLVEGLSAKTLAMAGRPNNDFHGVYPLKGKLLNTRDASANQRSNNKELTDMKKILGLVEGKVYTSIADLRYGKILIMTDQDHDGFHIKGLLLNWLHCSWPSLAEMPCFIEYLRTPIVKATKGTTVKEFYALPQFDKWRQTKSEKSLKKYHIKYYKGLGTSTAAEAKGYFKEIDKNKVCFQFTNKKEDNNNLSLAFSKKRADDRKEWLRRYDEEKIPDNSQEVTQSVSDFINHELIQFSYADNKRSLPSAIDGFKPSQRKILFVARSKPLTTEMKVSQFASLTSSVSNYKHGEASLLGAIINMAQDYSCSGNNINLLQPNGAFGSRLMNGADHASARYIYTELSKVTNKIFRPEDDPILEYLDDDGIKIEPKFFIPVISMSLVNGSSGIGTGFSTNIMPHNPLDIISNIRKHLNGKRMKKLVPYFKGFKGQTEIVDDVVTFKGNYIRTGDKQVTINELLPVSKYKSTNNYKEFLISQTMENSKDTKKLIKDFVNYSTDTEVKFVLTFRSKADLDKLLKNEDEFLKKFKLIKSEKHNNIHCFNHKNVITKYKNTNDILKEFIKVRLDAYSLRKKYMLKVFEDKIILLSAKVKFLKEIIAKTLKIMNVPEETVVAHLKSKGYPKIDSSYDYLLNMNIRSFTKEKIKKLQNELDENISSKDKLDASSIQELWINDLDSLEKLL